MMNLLATTGPNLGPALQPVYSILSVLLPILLGLIFVIGMFVCVSLGIAYAKSDENGTHEKAKKDLVNAIIGFVLIFVLIGVLYLVRTPLLEWISSITNDYQFEDTFVRIVRK